jgi:hypothetical protein
VSGCASDKRRKDRPTLPRQSLRQVEHMRGDVVERETAVTKSGNPSAKV